MVAFLLQMVRRQGPSILPNIKSNVFLEVDSQVIKKFIAFAGSLGFLCFPFNLVTYTCIRAYSNESLMDRLVVNISTKSQRNVSLFLVITIDKDVSDDCTLVL